MSKILDTLDRPIAFQRRFVDLTGSVTAALFLSQAVYWQKRAKQADGWWYKSAEEWQEETGLTRHEQKTAREKCEKYLYCELRSVPATLHWKVNEQALADDLFSQFDEKQQSSLPESGKLVLQNPVNKFDEKCKTLIESETTQRIPENEEKKFLDPIDHALSFKAASQKAQIAIQIESAVKVRLGMEATSTKNGMKFVEYAVKKHMAGEDYSRFIDWYLANTEKKFRSFNNMIEKWPGAFPAQEKRQERQNDNFNPTESY